jgi:hypothetical protein
MTLPDGYSVETIANSGTAPDTELEATDLSTRPSGNLLVTTRGGELWEYAPDSEGWTLRSNGLHQTTGVWTDEMDDPENIYVAQKPRLTRLANDSEGPEVDVYETLANDWGLTGDYHEWVYGPVRDSEGNFYVNTSLAAEGGSPCSGVMTIHHPDSYRGWAIKITPDGEFIPWANGFRSPLGIGINADDEVFYSDQQGDFNPVCSIARVEEGGFYGHPISLGDDPDWPDYSDLCGSSSDIDEYNEARKPPVAWIPYNLVTSGAGVTFDMQGNFGPFEGQAFFGCQENNNLTRLSMEEVNGSYQGAVFPFTDIDDFQCGTVAEAFSADGSKIYVAETSRGFGDGDPEPYGVERVNYDGETTPFAMHSIEILSSGFRVNFTRAADTGEAGDAGNYELAHWTYNYHNTYGSGRVNESSVGVSGVSVVDDGMAVEIELPSVGPADVSGTRTPQGRVYEISLDGVAAADGSEMTHSVGWYTVNDVPN